MLIRIQCRNKNLDQQHFIEWIGFIESLSVYSEASYRGENKTFFIVNESI